MNPSIEVPEVAQKRQVTRVLMGYQGITVKDMCQEDKIEGLQSLIHDPFLSYYFSFARPRISTLIQHIIKRVGLQEDFGKYFCRISMYQFSWTHWVKNNNRPNYSQELKRVLAWPSSHYSNYPWSFFVFMGNLVAHDVVASLIYFRFIYTLFFLYKSKRYMCLCNVGKSSSFIRRVKPSFAWFFWEVFHMVLSFHINLINKKCCIKDTYAIFFINFSNTLRVSMCSGQIVKKITIYFFTNSLY